MPVFKLDENGQGKLAGLPETGMGFQIVQARIPGHDVDDIGLFVVLGSRLLLPARDLDELNAGFQEVADSGVSSLDEFLESGVPISVDQVSEARVVATRLDRELGREIERTVDEGTRKRARALMKLQPLVSEVKQRPSVQAYFRFSPLRKDPHVRDDGGFEDNTYATTYNDMRMVPSGFAAVGRYALPKPFSASYVYIILTDTLPSYIGACTPNFGQAGGGVEVLFKTGAKAVQGSPHEIPAF